MERRLRQKLLWPSFYLTVRISSYIIRLACCPPMLELVGDRLVMSRYFCVLLRNKHDRAQEGSCGETKVLIRVHSATLRPRNWHSGQAPRVPQPNIPWICSCSLQGSGRRERLTATPRVQLAVEPPARATLVRQPPLSGTGAVE